MKDRTKDFRGATMAAGILMLALSLIRQFRLEDATPEQVCKALGVSRSQGYEWAARLRRQMEALPGPGRPVSKRQQTDLMAGGLAAALRLCKAVRDWLLKHPGGAVAGHKRNAYTDDFRSFVIDLLTDEGTLAGLGRTEQAESVGVRPDTLARWLSPPLAATEAPAPPFSTGDTATATQAPVAPPTLSSDDAPSFSALPTEPEVPPTEELVARPQPPEALEIAVLPQPPEALESATVVLPAPSPQPAAFSPATTAARPPLPSMTRSDSASRILAMRKGWKGTRQAFYRCVRGRGISYSDGAIRAVLKGEQKLPMHPRRPKNPNAEATRGDYLRPAPNSQWVEDGTTIPVTVGDNSHPFTVQQTVDNGSDFHAGVAVVDHESSKGLLNSLEDAKQTTGTTPLALIRDGRKCNRAKGIDGALAEEDIISQLGTARRPQSNAIAENAFSHLKQHLPDLVIPASALASEKELARVVLAISVKSYQAGRNQTPRRRLGNRTPAQVQAEHVSTPEQSDEEKTVMRRIQRRLLDEADTEGRRNREATLKLVQQVFDELKLPDPKHKKVPAIARYGLEAATEAIAVLMARMQGGTGPEAHPERFLLSTTRRIAYHHQDTRAYEHLLDLRIRAADLVVKPLREELDRLRKELVGDDFLKAVLYRATASPTAPDRVFWRRVFMAEFDSLPPKQRPAKGRWAAARIAGRLQVPYLERQYFLTLIAASAVPLVA